ncbi:MAG TPA: methyltransferase domain-containing protein [Sporichthya sp.]|nr:methyltransferase domain-containing protein [Sporichthya sp.]
MTDYALRMSPEELGRYRMMAAQAQDLEAELWAQAGIVPGARVVDLGCGPGAALLAMAEVVGADGSVYGVDGDPAAVAVAESLIAGAGLTNASVVVGDVAASALPPEPMDVAVLRHVLAHNGSTEQAIVDHAASLVRPGGCVYLVDVDATMLRSRPRPPLMDEVQERYLAYHAQRGNDLRVGLRLADLLERAGLDIVVETIRVAVVDIPRGFRPPAWAAREAMVAAGVISAGDVERWAAGYAEIDAGDRRLRGFFPTFVAAGRKPL